MRAFLLASLAALCLLTPHPIMAAQDGVTVVVFDGRGLGHGVGLPLDGANALARDGASATAILDRFYPGSDRGKASGLVRVLIAARDDAGRGFDVVLPDGGTVRDGRVTAVAPSFPIRVPRGGTVRITFSDGFSRAEVLDDRSVSGTVEVTPTSSPAPTTTPPSTGPGLGASQQSIWVEPRDRGRVVVPPDGDGGEERTVRGLVEAVVEGDRLHLVAELDVEDYLTGLDLTLPGEPAIEAAALDAAVIAARSYAVRSARAEPRVGRFHLYADTRSLPYVGRDAAPDGVAEATTRTAGQVIEHEGQAAVALITVSAGGGTSNGGDVFGPAGDLPYLRSVEYQVSDEFRWTVEMPLPNVAARLGFEGEPTDVDAVIGDRSRVEVAGLLGLPSPAFDAHGETRDEAVAERADSPAFQELPLPVIEPTPAGAEADESGVPWTLVVVGAGSLLTAALVLRMVDVQRRVKAARERRAARRRHPAESDQPPRSVT